MKSAQVQTAVPTDAPQEGIYMPSLGSFKSCSLILGLLVGFFIYLSTLGAEFVAVMLWGREILTKSNNELILFSLSWNLITTFLALLVLTSLRRMVVAVAHPLLDATRPNADDIVAELLSYLEGRFAVGALVGICISWNLTNLVLGMRPQIIQSCVILAVACLWCRLTLILLGKSDSSLIQDVAEEAPRPDFVWKSPPCATYSSTTEKATKPDMIVASPPCTTYSAGQAKKPQIIWDKPPSMTDSEYKKFIEVIVAASAGEGAFTPDTISILISPPCQGYSKLNRSVAATTREEEQHARGDDDDKTTPLLQVV